MWQGECDKWVDAMVNRRDIYASDIREILAYNRTQHKDIMSELNVQFFMADGTIQIKK